MLTYPQRAGEVYGPLMVTMLSEQSARQSSIEQRALAVITTSGVLWQSPESVDTSS